MLSRCLVEIFVDGRFPFVRRDVMLQVAIRPPEGEHAPEYKLVQREEASQLRRRSRAAFFAERTQTDDVGSPADEPIHQWLERRPESYQSLAHQAARGEAHELDGVCTR